MNRYLMIRRLRWPLFLLLVGVLALLHQADILRWHHSWPIFLIYFGAFMLTERAALTLDQQQSANEFNASSADYSTTATEHVETTGAEDHISTHENKGVQL